MIDTHLFDNMEPDKSFIETILQFDIRELEHTDAVKISQYCIALGQYLIYLRYQLNKTKVEMSRKKRLLDGVISQRLTPELIKRLGTKTNAVDDIMKNSNTISKLQTEMEPMQDELMLLAGLDKTISELIAAFKRELTRRENELYTTRQERKS